MTESYVHWPHRPAHLFVPNATYMVTAGTLHKALFFLGGERLQKVRQELFAAAEALGWQLQAWALFPNHYHFIAVAPVDPTSLPQFIQRVHSATSRWLNRIEGQKGRQVWYQYWDSCITFEGSYCARLNYVHHNPVHHRLVKNAEQYEFCSARWFTANADREFAERVSATLYDRIKVEDDF